METERAGGGCCSLGSGQASGAAPRERASEVNVWGGEWIQARSLSTFRTDTAVRLCRRSRSLYVCVSVCVCSGPVAGPGSGAAFDARFVCDV